MDRASEHQSRRRHLQECHADSARHHPDRRCQSRGPLHDARLEAGGRASGDEVEFLGDRDKGFQMSIFHGWASESTQ
jgi:hypothetical protein